MFFAQGIPIILPIDYMKGEKDFFYHFPVPNFIEDHLDTGIDLLFAKYCLLPGTGVIFYKNILKLCYPDHSISTKYTIGIEKQISVHGVDGLTKRIILEYCKSVHKYSLSGYSLPVKEAIIMIRKNLPKPVCLESISLEVNVSREHLCRNFKKETSMNISDYVHYIKINESLNLVKSKSYSISEISEMFRHCNAAYFSVVFKKVTGMAPRTYRKMQGETLQRRVM